jgi:hypothetical protein
LLAFGGSRIFRAQLAGRPLAQPQEQSVYPRFHRIVRTLKRTPLPRQSRSRSPEGRRFPLIAAHLPRETFGVGIGIAIGFDHRNGEARITLKADSDADADSGPDNHSFAVALRRTRDREGAGGPRAPGNRIRFRSLSVRILASLRSILYSDAVRAAPRAVARARRVLRFTDTDGETLGRPWILGRQKAPLPHSRRNSPAWLHPASSSECSRPSCPLPA